MSFTASPSALLVVVTRPLQFTIVKVKQEGVHLRLTRWDAVIVNDWKKTLHGFQTRVMVWMFTAQWFSSMTRSPRWTSPPSDGSRLTAVSWSQLHSCGLLGKTIDNVAEPSLGHHFSQSEWWWSTPHSATLLQSCRSKACCLFLEDEDEEREEEAGRETAEAESAGGNSAFLFSAVYKGSF